MLLQILPAKTKALPAVVETPPIAVWWEHPNYVIYPLPDRD
jgi:hypothetical protein